MKLKLATSIAQIGLRRALALLASTGLGLGLLALLLAGLRPSVAAAAGLAGPATVYSCTEPGLNSALAAGGSATFSCSVPTTITLSSRKTVTHNVTLDGGNKLILSGGFVTGVFTVGTGVNFNLLNLTLRDAQFGEGAAIDNRGNLNATHVTFFNNQAGIGAALFNEPGAFATVQNSSVISNSGKGGALANGNPSGPTSATLIVASSVFSANFAGDGAGIFNYGGVVTVTGSTFENNHSFSGGAIWDNGPLWVTNSHFTHNLGGSLVLDSLAQLNGLPNLPAAPGGVASGGGAIYLTAVSDGVIRGSDFSNNAAVSVGGAIQYGLLPPTVVLTNVHSLSIDSSTFTGNCATGLGGALSADVRVQISNSAFQENAADSTNTFCFLALASAVGRQGANGPASPRFLSIPQGSGGAIFNSFMLSVTYSSFISNTASVTETAGGGAIDNYVGSSLSVAGSSFTGNTTQTNGGAIFNDAVSGAQVIGSDFNHNSAPHGWGGAIANFGGLAVSYSNFSANSDSPTSLDAGGGAIASFNPGPPILLSNGHGQSHGQAPHAPSAPAGLLSNFLTVDHSTFTANTSEYEGGAIDAGPASIHDSSFISNSAAFGGAIDALGPISVTADNFTANAVVTTTDFSANQGGAIDTNGESTAIVNSTFYRNRAEGVAEGGAINVDDEFTNTFTAITNTTFLSNSADTNGQAAAIFSQSPGKAVLRDVLLAYNIGATCNLTVTFSGANLDYPGSDHSCGSASLTGNPFALPPTNNGGPTFTSALLPGSPAIDAGDNPGCPSADQRGAARPFNGQCDIGAYEFGVKVPFLWAPLVRK